MKSHICLVCLLMVSMLGCSETDDSNSVTDVASNVHDTADQDAPSAPTDTSQAHADASSVTPSDSAGVGDDTGRPDLAWNVTEDGPYQAGHRTVEVTYLPASTGQERTLLVHLWYPTEATSGDDVTYVEIFVDENVLGNAPLAPPAAGETYPVHVHSHGDLGYAGSSPYLMRHFATHGWVVAAPDHKGNTIMDNISPRPAWMYTVRLEDISATLDQLDALPEDDPLSGKLQVDQVLLSGHSYGAYTTLGLSGADYDMAQIASICAKEESGACSPELLSLFETGFFEERVVAAIPMAPGSYAMYGEGISDIGVPIMHMTGSDDRPQSNADIWSALPSPSVRVHVEGGCHQLFALGGCDLIDDDPGLMIVNAYALAFGRQRVLHDESLSSLLDGSEVLDESVTFSVK